MRDFESGGMSLKFVTVYDEVEAKALTDRARRDPLYLQNVEPHGTQLLSRGLLGEDTSDRELLAVRSILAQEIGFVGYNLDLIARCGYVGPLFLFEQYRGRGHARAILKALSEILFVEREVEYIGATVFECARASKVAFEAVGFRHVGFQPVAIRYRGKPYGAHFFGMTRPS